MRQVFLCVLSFLYTGKPRDITPEMAIEVMSLANLYNIEPLKKLCAEIVTRGLSVQNAAYILQVARRRPLAPTWAPGRAPLPSRHR